MANRQTAEPSGEEPAAARSPRKSGAQARQKPSAEEKPAAVATEEPSPLTRDVPEHRENTDVMGTKRRMPVELRRFLLRVPGDLEGTPQFYLPAAYRIVWFRNEMGDEWGIRTQLIEGGYQAGFATVYAEILDPQGRVIASDFKTESKQNFPAGWVEKASTGAVSRALALLGFGTQFMPELDDDAALTAGSREMTSGPARRVTINEIWEGPGQCPKCHAPEGKRHGKPCIA